MALRKFRTGGATAEQEMIRDRLVLGTCHLELQEQFIRTAKPTLENVVMKSKLFERNSEQTKEMQHETGEHRSVDAVK